MHYAPILDRIPLAAPLVLVSDPDGLLNEEHLLAELHHRGFTVIREDDPVRLRYRITHSPAPWIVITTGPLNTLPYDLWQKGEHVELALHTFFPHLAYPPLRALTPLQRSRLFQAPPPPRRLGEQATIEYVFRHVFGLDWGALNDPFTLIAWLSDSLRREPLPTLYRQKLLQRLATLDPYRDWPLEKLLNDPEALGEFIQDQWQSYLHERGLLRLGEARTAYLFDFDQPRWQGLLSHWLRTGLLHPPMLQVDAPEPWMAAAVLTRGEDARLKRLHLLMDALGEALDPAPDTFEAWAHLAWQWAELLALYYTSDEIYKAENPAVTALRTRLEKAIIPWLQARYTALGTHPLPQPRHLWHVSHYLASLRRQGQAEAIALIVLDGMSLADWLVLWEIWGARHRWLAEVQLLLAQIPTITAISRQALIGGLRPAEFAESITHNQREARLWQTFWSREGLGAHACMYTREPNDLHLSPDLQALCVVITAVDEIHHHTLLGPVDAQASLRRWGDRHAASLENMLERLLQAGFTVFLTSDHGNTVAYGIGQPREGAIVQTRGLRARTYRDENLARRVQSEFPETYLWHGDGLLPDDLWVLIPQDHMAFAAKDEIYITHGGLTPEEMWVPLVKLTLRTG
ncbi:MAG: BREX-3 system phosphatase PglZ [Anaerolineales bacterium]